MANTIIVDGIDRMNKPKFNWYMELDKTIKAEPNHDKYEDLSKRANEWVTCACGQLCKALPRDMQGKPEDLKLFSMGLDFSHSIFAKHWYQALETLNKIESRTSQLLNEQNNG
ncbi:MAG: hypothetical protein [Cryophage ML09]|nr:MAG: hypothetical protein [Cryophage ML09]